MRWRHRAEAEAWGVANVRRRAARSGERMLGAARPIRESSPAPRDALKHAGHFLEPVVKLGDEAVALSVAVCGSAPALALALALASASASHSVLLWTGARRVVPAALRVDKQSRRRRVHRTTPTAMARSRYSLAPQATPAKGTK